MCKQLDKLLSPQAHNLRSSSMGCLDALTMMLRSSGCLRRFPTSSQHVPTLSGLHCQYKQPVVAGGI
jgi:hypothetical protein